LIQNLQGNDATISISLRQLEKKLKN